MKITCKVTKFFVFSLPLQAERIKLWQQKAIRARNCIIQSRK